MIVLILELGPGFDIQTASSAECENNDCRATYLAWLILLEKKNNHDSLHKIYNIRSSKVTSEWRCEIDAHNTTHAL